MWSKNKWGRPKAQWLERDQKKGVDSSILWRKGGRTPWLGKDEVLKKEEVDMTGEPNLAQQRWRGACREHLSHYPLVSLHPSIHPSLWNEDWQISLVRVWHSYFSAGLGHSMEQSYKSPYFLCFIMSGWVMQTSVCTLFGETSLLDSREKRWKRSSLILLV